MEVFAVKTRIEKPSQKKLSEDEIAAKENSRDNRKEVLKQKLVEYYFRDVRFDPSHAAVRTNVQPCKLLT